MLYKVKEVSKLSGATIKTLHYYHKINLLVPHHIDDYGHRFYNEENLLKLQEILFYREMDFSIKDIINIFEKKFSRLEILEKQETLLKQESNRLKTLLETINESIEAERLGTKMNTNKIFKGLSDKEWNEALASHNEHLKKQYNYEMEVTTEDKVEKLNTMAVEAKRFTNLIIELLRNNIKSNDPKAINAVKSHIEFLNNHGNNFSYKDYLNQTEFFINDDFHRLMLESQQTGLSYYLNSIARMLNS